MPNGEPVCGFVVLGKTQDGKGVVSDNCLDKAEATSQALALRSNRSMHTIEIFETQRISRWERPCRDEE